MSEFNLREAKKELIIKALNECKKIHKACEKLEMSQRHLYRVRKKYGIIKINGVHQFPNQNESKKAKKLRRLTSEMSVVAVKIGQPPPTYKEIKSIYKKSKGQL